MSFTGMLYGFLGRDMGLKGAVDDTTKNLEDINGLLEDQSDIAEQSKVKDLFEALNTINIGNIADSMNDLTGETGQLTNSIEGMAVANAKAIRPMIAAMGKTGDEARKMESRVSSMAISMNVGADAVMDVVRSMDQSGEAAKGVMDEMGLSQKEWVKVTEATGVKMDDFTTIAGDMVASWGASNKEAGDMINNLMAIGQAAGTGNEMLKNAAANYAAINTQFQELPPGMARSAGEIKGLMESTAKLSGAFVDMGDSQEVAAQRAQETGMMFAKQAVDMEKMLKTGEGNIEDLPMMQFLMEMGVGFEDARDIIQLGSRDVVAGTQKINDIFTKLGGDKSPAVQRSLGKLGEFLGSSADGLTYLAQSSTTGADSLAKMAAITVDGSNALKNYGNQAFTTGRTLEESLQHAKDMFETRFRSIARKDVRGFVRNQRKAYKSLGDDIKGLAKDETWGPLVNRFSAVSQLGVKGFFAPLGKDSDEQSKKFAKFAAITGFATDQFGAMSKAMAPMGSMLAGFMPLFSSLFKVVGKFGKLLFGWPAILIGIGLGIAALVKNWDKVKAFFENFGEKALSARDFVKDFKKKFDEMDIPKVLGDLGQKISKGIGDFFADIITMITPGGGAVPEDSFAVIAVDILSMVGSMLQDVGIGIMEILIGIVHKLVVGLYDVAVLGMEHLIGAVADVLKNAAEFWVNLFQPVTTWFTELPTKIMNMITEAGTFLAEAGASIITLIFDGMKEKWNGVKDWFGEKWQKLQDMLPWNSPPKDTGSPLAGLENAGQNILDEILKGAKDYQTTFQNGFAKVLTDSMEFAITAYEGKIKDLLSKSTVLEDAGKKLTAQLTGKIDFGEGTPEIRKEVKNEMTALLSVPGMAGVTAAIIVEGAKTRKVLKNIEKNTSDIANNTSGFTFRGGGLVAVLPS